MEEEEQEEQKEDEEEVVSFWIILVKSLLKRYTMNTLSNITTLSHKLPLYRFAYIKSYSGVLFHLYNSEKIILCNVHSPVLSDIKWQLHDQWRTLNGLKDSKIKTPAPVWEVEIIDIGCHMYFVILEGERVVTNKFWQPGSGALTHFCTVYGKRRFFNINGF